MYRLVSIVVCFAALECFAGSTLAEPAVPRAALRNAPQSIRIDGVALHLEAEVWRDFMPGWVPSDTQSEEPNVPGKPMTAELRVVARNGLQIPQKLRVEVAWVMLRQQIWQSQPAEEQPRDPAAHEVAVTIRNGPKWPPQARVDIVVRIVDGNGATYLLASRGQKIRAAT
jgi:hypothetical protein